MPPTPSYWQSREPATAKQSPRRAAAPDMAMESPKTRCSSSKGRAPRGSGCNSKTSTLKHPDSTLAKTPPHPQESTPDCPVTSMQACSSQKHGRSPSPTRVSQKQMKGPQCDGLWDSQHHPASRLLLSPPLPWVRQATGRGGLSPLRAGCHLPRFLPAQVSTYPGFHPWGLGA